MSRPRHARLVPLPGDEDLVPTPRAEAAGLAARLWPKVAGPWISTEQHPITERDCWLWIAAARTGGYRSDGRGRRRRAGPDTWDYGRIHAPAPGQPKRLIGAHRAAYELVRGDIPAGLMIRHTCNERLCCNPWHLEVGTAADNAQDIQLAGRVTGGRAHRRQRQQETAA